MKGNTLSGSIWCLGRENSAPEASPKVSKVKNNAGAPGLKKVARVFPIGLEPPARAEKDQHGKCQEQSLH